MSLVQKDAFPESRDDSSIRTSRSCRRKELWQNKQLEDEQFVDRSEDDLSHSGIFWRKRKERVKVLAMGEGFLVLVMLSGERKEKSAGMTQAA